jgi:hypothetical protein
MATMPALRAEGSPHYQREDREQQQVAEAEAQGLPGWVEGSPTEQRIEGQVRE